MIGYLHGKPIVSGTDLLIVVSGVGYRLKVGLALLARVSSSADLEVYVHTHVKEDILELYGFSTVNERNIFELLLGVSGVGPRTALALTEVGTDKIIEAVQQANVEILSHVPRVGKKLAQKIIIELKPKLGDLQSLHFGPTSQIESDVQAALLSLGFGEREIQQAFLTLDFTSQDTAQLVKQAIKSMTVRSS